MSVAEAVEAVATPSAPLTGKALFRNLHTREFLGHKKKVSTLEAIVEGFACPSTFCLCKSCRAFEVQELGVQYSSVLEFLEILSRDANRRRVLFSRREAECNIQCRPFCPF